MGDQTAHNDVVLTEEELRDALRQSGVAAVMNNNDRGRELDERILSSHAALAAQVEQLVELAHKAICAVDDPAVAGELGDRLDQVIAQGGYDEELARAKGLAGAFLVGLRMTLDEMPDDRLAQTQVSRAFLELVEKTVADLSSDRGEDA